MSGIAKSFQDALNPESVGPDTFQGYGPKTHWKRVYGGLVISQALVAAIKTVSSEKKCHSLHGYFLLPGDPTLPVIYKVERLRDGASFSARQCKAFQNDKVIFELLASFHIDEEGFEHAIEMPATAPPDSLLSFAQLKNKLAPERKAPVFEYFAERPPLEFRPVDQERYYGAPHPGSKPPHQATWLRLTDPLSDELVVQQAALAYASDMTLLDCALVAHGRSVTDGTIQPASLDHAIWFHRPSNLADWHLYVQESPNANGARGLSIGRIYSSAGILVATMAQEGLIRRRDRHF